MKLKTIIVFLSCGCLFMGIPGATNQESHVFTQEKSLNRMVQIENASACVAECTIVKDNKGEMNRETLCEKREQAIENRNITRVEKDSDLKQRTREINDTQTQEVVDKFSLADLRYMTSIIYCEARGEGYVGQKAVGIVVMNRVRSNQFPNSVESVVYDSGQFAPVYNGSLDRALSIYDSSINSGQWNDAMLDCQSVAKEVLNGSTVVECSGASLDMSDYLFFSCYVENARQIIGNHMFK